MAIALDAASQARLASYGTSSVTFAHTVSGDDRYLVVCVQKSGNAFSALTYGGVALTRIVTSDATATNPMSEIWGLVAPAVGTANIVATMPSVYAEAQLFASSWTGVDQTTPVKSSAFTANAFYSSPLTTTVSTVAGDVVVDSAAASETTATACDATQTQLGTGTTTSGFYAGASYKSAPSSMVWSWSGGSRQSALAAIVLGAASGGSTSNDITIADSQQVNTASSASVSQGAAPHNITIANSQQVNQGSSASISSAPAGSGTITTPPIRDWGTKTLKTGISGVQMDVRNISTGALYVRKTGITPHATTAVCVATDALIPNTTLCEVVMRFPDGSVGVWDLMSV